MGAPTQVKCDLNILTRKLKMMISKNIHYRNLFFQNWRYFQVANNHCLILLDNITNT